MTFRKYLAVATAVVVGIIMIPVRAVMNLIDEHVLDVDNVLSGFTKLQDKLDRAAVRALEKGDNYVDQANYYNELADEAYSASDRAARAKMRLSKLLD